METIDREALSARLSPEQLVRGAGGVSYRAQQLALVTVTGREQPLPTPLRNAGIESVLVHLRALAWFFLPRLNADDDKKVVSSSGRAAKPYVELIAVGV